MGFVSKCGYLFLLQDIMRCWIKDHPVNTRRLTEGSVALNILKQEPDLQASFLPHPCANPASRQKGLVRWQQNPEREWGPKPRARREGNDAKNLQQVEEVAEMKRSHPEVIFLVMSFSLLVHIVQYLVICFSCLYIICYRL